MTFVLNTDGKIIDLEKRASFDFFWQEGNFDPASLGYGLIRDNTSADERDFASIASNGFGFGAAVIGVKNGYIDFDEAYARTLGTLKTYAEQAEQYQGFFWHFLNINSGRKFPDRADCASIIDTSLLLGGMIVAGEYFGGEVAELVEKIYSRVDWTKYLRPDGAFYMGLDPVRGGFGSWNMYAEQMMMYFLAVGSPTYNVSPSVYRTFSRETVTYAGHEFMTAPRNALFTHQYSHAFVDFSQMLGPDGLDFAENSRQATLAQRQFALDNRSVYKTFGPSSWGQSACSGPHGYRAYGTGYDNQDPKLVEQDGTIAPTAASGSIVFTPAESIDAMNAMAKVPGLWGKYGLIDSYNFDVQPEFRADKYIGIDKGIALLMLENYQSGLIWKLFMQNRWIAAATEELGFVKK